ncbi:zinc finger MYM-type protein 1-like [Aphis craccivora]|uniref:Zinc finger MYM-type protein 1-like n=1 Tax=Aphis craccivora TaxID=307492 RepID=A0A6G0Y418_APHCR|nr:zinc finger MYM-type protein 1-like [Aphis craccivora]
MSTSTSNSLNNKKKGGAEKMRDKRKAQLNVIANDSKQRKLNFSVRPSASASSNDDVMLIEDNFKVSLLPLPIEKECSLVKDIEKSVLPVEIEKESVLVKNSESECITLNHTIVPGHGNIFHDISISKNDSPVQPELVKFPVTNGRRFNTKYYKDYEWLEYSVSKDSLFCFVCRHFGANIPSPGEMYGNYSFVNNGNNCKKWKEIKSPLDRHQRINRHVISMQRWVDYRSVQAKNNLSIANQLNSSRQHEINENRLHVHFLLKATLFLAKQGLPFRGHNETFTSTNKGNFIELLQMFGDEKLNQKLQSRYGHYTSPEYQNDLIAIIAKCTRQQILKKINKFDVFTIMVDETKDKSKKEQMSFVIRFLDDNFNIHEKSIGCYHMVKSDSESLFNQIINIISENNLNINKCVAQCYDGASVMSGAYTGVQERIRSKVSHAIYVHCYAHRLNLCLIQTLQNIPFVVNFFNTVQETYKFLMNSQTRYELFTKVQKDHNLPVLHLERLVDTRWAYWYSSLSKINSRYTEIIEVLSILGEEGDQTARATGILNEMSKFSFIIMAIAMESLLKVIHCASTELQNSSIILPAAIDLIKCTRQSLNEMRSDTFWVDTIKNAELIATKNGIPTNHRSSRSLCFNKRLKDYFTESSVGNTSNNTLNNSVNELKVLFYSAIDRFMNELDKRFNDTNNNIILTCTIFISSDPDYFNFKSPYLQAFLDHYNYFKINPIFLESEFLIAKNLLSKNKNITREDGVHDLFSISKKLLEIPNSFPETLKIISILMTLPVSTASNERFFSSLKRIKTCLRLTMTDERLSDLLVIAVEGDEASKVDLQEAIDLFADMKSRRYPLKA